MGKGYMENKIRTVISSVVVDDIEINVYVQCIYNPNIQYGLEIIYAYRDILDHGDELEDDEYDLLDENGIIREYVDQAYNEMIKKAELLDDSFPDRLLNKSERDEKNQMLFNRYFNK